MCLVIINKIDSLLWFAFFWVTGQMVSVAPEEMLYVHIPALISSW